MRDPFMKHVAGPSIRTAETDLALAGHMKTVLDVLERGRWHMEGEAIVFAHDADATEYEASIDALEQKLAP